MIQTDLMNNGALLHTYSDAGMALLQQETGVIYLEAVDSVPCRYTYTEVANPYPEEDLTDTEALNIITGGDAHEA